MMCMLPLLEDIVAFPSQVKNSKPSLNDHWFYADFLPTITAMLRLLCTDHLVISRKLSLKLC